MTSIALTNEGLNWDMFADGAGNIAMVSDSSAVAQDVACAVKTFLGEVYFDTTLGVPYFTQVLGKRYSRPLLESLINAQALTVAGVVKAKTSLTGYSTRSITGSVEVIDAAGVALNVNF